MGTVPRFGVQRTKLISVNSLTWAECEAAVRGRLHRHHRRCRCRRRRRRHCRRAARVAQEKNCVLLNHACEAAQFVVFPKQIWVVFIPCPNFYVPFKTDDGTLLKLELQTRTGAKSYYKGVNEARPGLYRVDHKQLAAAGVKLKNNSYETQVGAAKALARSPSPSMAPSPPHLIEPPCR